MRCGGSKSGDVRNKGRKQRRKGRVPGEGSGGGKLGSVQGGEVDGARMSAFVWDIGEKLVVRKAGNGGIGELVSHGSHSDSCVFAGLQVH